MTSRRVHFSASMLVLSAALVSIRPACADDQNSIIAGFEELRLPSASAISVCHGFGCRLRTEIELLPSDRVTLAKILRAGAASAAAERSAIASAVAWFDRRVGPVAGTQHHIARATGSNVSNADGQFDCIDTSHNTTSLLQALAELRLLRHHRVEQPQSRGWPINSGAPHATAVVTELKSGVQWAIDMWTHAAGERPDVMPLQQWLASRE